MLIRRGSHLGVLVSSGNDDAGGCSPGYISAPDFDLRQRRKGRDVLSLDQAVQFNPSEDAGFDGKALRGGSTDLAFAPDLVQEIQTALVFFGFLAGLFGLSEIVFKVGLFDWQGQRI